eukprot:5287702-Amphidinium_carterae.2
MEGISVASMDVQAVDERPMYGNRASSFYNVQSWPELLWTMVMHAQIRSVAPPARLRAWPSATQMGKTESEGGHSK